MEAIFSFGAIAFLLIVFVLYWTIGTRGANWQNAILLLAGVCFYGWLDARFLGLLLFSAAANYLLGGLITSAPTEAVRSRWFWVGIAINFGLLGYFKYFGFFQESFADLMVHFGGSASHTFLAIALPLGISYFTFQMAGYLIDIRNGATEPCRQPLHFFAYVFHFPKLLAGPFEPAQHFLPRIAVVRSFDASMASRGLEQVLWGVFAKMVIAENCGRHVDRLFADIPAMDGSTLFLGALLYLIQIYADFSGYSNMAIGASKLLGIPLMVNFRAPLFATNIAEFWRRWHISLTMWMMDRVFTPLTFLLRRHGKMGLALSIFVTFLAVGLWHGANWTFILFGTLQGIYFLPLVIGGTMERKRTGNSLAARTVDLAAMVCMFVLMALTFVLLRAPSISIAWEYWSRIFSASLIARPQFALDATPILVLFFLLAEWSAKGFDHALSLIDRNWPVLVRWTSYAFVLFLVGMYMSPNGSPFIYFSF